MGCCFSRGLQTVRYLFASAVVVLAGCGGGGGTTGGGVDTIPVATSSSAPLLSIEAAYDTPGQARGTLKDGSYVYVADGASGLFVLRISANNRFSKISSLPLTTNTTNSRAYSLVKQGNYLYMAAREEGVHVINVANPFFPVRVTTIPTVGFASYLTINQDRLYISAGNSLYVVDITTNPNNPVVLGSVTGTSINQHLLVENNTVYLAAYTGGLRIVDVSHPAAPVILSNTRASNNAGAYYNVNAIAKKDKYVYLGGGGSGVLVYDVSDLSKPKLVNQIDLPGSAPASAPHSIVVWGNFLFVADGDAGVRVLDITLPFVPKLVGLLNTPGSVQDLFIDGVTMVTADFNDGVQLINIFETTDRDGDGVMDGADAFPDDPKEWADSDGDGIGNNAESDDDNDGVLDVNDAFPTDPSEWMDTDGDRVGDNSDVFPLNPLEWLDTDGDGTGNNADHDDDNDGIPDGIDAYPLDAFNIIRITTDSKGHRHPKLENNLIVWRGYTSSGAPSIFVKDLVTGETKNISQGISGFIGIPALSNGQVAWRVWNEVDRTYIYLWDGNETRIITDYDPGNFTMPWGYPPSYYSVDVSFENGRIAWAGWDGNDYEIYLWDGTTAIQITDNSIDDYEPQLSNNQIAWTATLENGVFEVFFWDGTSIHNVSNRLDEPDEDSHLRNGKIVWSGWTNSTYRRDIYIWDGVNTVVVNLPGDDYEPHIDETGKFVTWSNRNNGQYDVFIWDGYEVVQLKTANDFDENEPYANKGRIAFSQDTDVGADIYIAEFNIDKDGDGVVNGADAFPLDPARQ